MARKSSSNTRASPSRLAAKTLVFDNGSHTIKAGFSSHTAEDEPSVEKDCHVIANCIARSQRDKRTYVGPELLDECWDFGELAFRRPVEKGFVVNWESEKAIWERSIVDKRSPLQVSDASRWRVECVSLTLCQCDPHETNLILTEAPNAPSALQRNADEMVFEEFEFASHCRFIGMSTRLYH